ncbi:MAG: tetratricopeptide repeat protein [bacterium]|nr:tetratricopeptide repeat protein [bacterium]
MPCVLLIPIVSTWGCVVFDSGSRIAEAGASRSPSPTALQSSLPDYDPARAFMTFEEAVAKPELVAAPPGEDSPDDGELALQRTPLSSRGERHLQVAEPLVAAQRYTEAIRTLEKGLRSDPGASEIHEALARAAYGAGHIARARSHAAEAVRLNPDDLPSHYILGRLAYDEGDLRQAVDHFRAGRACSRGSQSVRGFGVLTELFLARALEAEGYLTAALYAYGAFEEQVAVLRASTPEGASAVGETAAVEPEELATLLRLNQGSAALETSRIHERLGQYGQAADALSVVIARGSPDLATRLRYAELLAAAGRYELALAQCKQVADQSPSDAGEVVAVLSRVREGMGRPRAVLEDAAALVRAHPDDRKWLLVYVDLLRRFGEHRRAEDALTEYVSAHPQATDVAWRLCHAYRDGGRGLEALQVAARILARSRQEYPAALSLLETLSQQTATVDAVFPGFRPSTLEERYLLGGLALRTGRDAEGAVLLGEVLDTSPGFAPARLALAEHLLGDYRWREVVELVEPFDRGLASLEWALGEAHAGLDDDDTAAAHYQTAIRLNRADTRSMLALARAYERTDRPLRAQRQYEALLEVDPLHTGAREALVSLLLESGLVDAAEEQVMTLRKLAGSPNCIARCTVRIGMRRGDLDVAGCRELLTDAQVDGGPDAESISLLAYLDVTEGDLEGAESTLAHALELDPDYLEARELNIWLHRRQLRFAQAATEMRSLLERHPNRLGWIKSLARILLIEQDYLGAAETLSAYLERNQPEDRILRDLRENLLQALRLGGDSAGEIATIRRWLVTKPDDPHLRKRLVDAQLAAGQSQAALDFAREWYSAEPDDGWARGAYRGALLAAGRHETALQIALEAVERDPQNENLQLVLVSVLADAGRPRDALEVLDSLMTGAQPGYPYYSAKLAILAQAERYEEAAALASQLLAEEDTSRRMGSTDELMRRQDLSRMLIGALLSAGRLDTAQARLSRWLDQADSSSEKFVYLNLLSAVYQQRDRSAEAVESLDLAYALHPRDAGVNNDLGYTLADLGLRLDEAERMVRFAVSQEPLNAAFLDSLGWVLYRRGRYAEARHWLLRASGTPDTLEDPVIYNHLGDACWRAGESDEAVRHWTKAVELATLRLAEREDATYRRVVETAALKRAAGEAGQPPPVAAGGDELNRAEDVPGPEADKPGGV